MSILMTSSKLVSVIYDVSLYDIVLYSVRSFASIQESPQVKVIHHYIFFKCSLQRIFEKKLGESTNKCIVAER